MYLFTMEIPITDSKNATIAKNGIQAERGICLQQDVKEALEAFFESPIRTITQVHGKKNDLTIEFENGVKTTLQNKDGGGGRGWSVDRRPLDRFHVKALNTLLMSLCIMKGKGTDRPIVPGTVSKDVLNMCVLGDEPPAYFTHTTSNKRSKRIETMGICSTDTLMDFMNGGVYETMVPKRTCVHLSPNCYLQRKGGGKTDSRPDDIQMKITSTGGMMALFRPIFPKP